MCIRDSVYSGIQAAQVLNSETENTVYSYFEDELIDQVVNDLMNIKGYTRTQAQNLVYSGGLSIYTTQDARIQSILDEEYADPSNYPDYVQYALDYAPVSYTHLDDTATEIDHEVMQLLHYSYEEAKRLLNEHREALDKIAGYLISRETITGKEFMKIFRAVEKGLEIPENLEDLTDEVQTTADKTAVENTEGLTAEETQAEPVPVSYTHLQLYELPDLQRSHL